MTTASARTPVEPEAGRPDVTLVAQLPTSSALDASPDPKSSLNAARGTAHVVIVDAATGATTTFDDVIGANHSAGGLHRARAAVPMGWADVQRPGRIYRVDP